MVLDIIVVMLLGYQSFRPESYNAKYSYTMDSVGLIRFNTQDGTAVRCTKELVCEEPKEKNNVIQSKSTPD